MVSQIPLSTDTGLFLLSGCHEKIKNMLGKCRYIKFYGHFPEIFESRAKLERLVGHSMLKDKNGPVYLDELDPDRGDMNTEIFPDCGIMCYLSMK